MGWIGSATATPRTKNKLSADEARRRTGRQGLSSQRAFPRSRWTNAKILQVLPVDCVVSVTVQMIRATGKCSNSAFGHS